MAEYEIKGTLGRISGILQEDFQMSQEETKFFLFILINQNENVNIDKKEVEEWYFAKEKKYNGRVFDTHYSINFSDVKRALYQKAYLFLLRFFLQRGFDIIQFGIDLLFVICSAMQRIDDYDFCVFARIIELNIGNKGRLFCQKDIQTANKENKCDFQEDEWKCPYLKEYDECINSAEKVKLSLEKLEDQSVIKSVGDFWVLQ